MQLIRLMCVVVGSLFVFSLCLAAETGGKIEAVASNSEYIKNGMPCIKELCIGDGLNELLKIKWDKARIYVEKVSKTQMANLEKKYRGNLTESARYIAPYDFSVRQIEFDNQTLLKLRNVIADCGFDTPSFIGKFVTEGGNLTKVEISLIPSSDNREQKWAVISIKRDFSNDNSEKQQDEIHAQLDARYGAFDYRRYNLGQPGYPAKDGDVKYMGDGLGFRLEAMWPNISELQRQHPLCSQPTKVNID